MGDGEAHDIHKDMKEEQRGPWLLTLLDGKAWDSVEHMSLEQLATKEGEQRLWQTLQDRFPEKEQHDILGEVLGEVFALAAESMKGWTSRVRETFDRCHRKASITFPTEAKGWVALHCAGLSEEQKAIVKAKTQGNLELDKITAALRSCFPLYKASGKKKITGVYLTENQEEDHPGEVLDGGASFQDVEAFLADHHQESDPAGEDDLILSEGEAAEALAVSWKDRRKEITKVKQDRQFGSSARRFRVQVEELKKKTRCRKCGKVGHWQRECTAPSSSKPSDSSGGTQTAVNYVEQCTTQQSEDVDLLQGPITPQFVGATEIFTAADGLVSSPGFGIVDSGCGRTLIGESTLKQLTTMIEQKGFGPVQQYEAANAFRFGNGAVEHSNRAAKIPVGLAGQFGFIDAAIISGQAPLLLGRPTLERLKACIDFSSGLLHIVGQQTPMCTNQAGQLLVNILQFPEIKPPVAGPSQVTRPQLSKKKVKITLKQKECRCLLAQVRKHETCQKSNIHVAELFSPPRFCLEAERRGLRGRAFDIKQGWDLDSPEVQKQVDSILDEEKPALLIACPPCTNRGGWDKLNRRYRTPLENARLLRRSRAQVRFCLQQIHKQVKRGGEFMFEHPWGAETWQDPDMIPLKRKYGIHRVDMCAYDLKCPDTGLPIQKATGLLQSCSDKASSHIRTCPGNHTHQHVAGKLTSGQTLSSFVAQYTSCFVKSMCDLFSLKSLDMDAEVLLTETGNECLAVDAPSEAVEIGPADAETAEAETPSPAVLSALKRLHTNLGHPSTREFLRVLKHSKASQEAINAAKNFQCSVCDNNRQPTSALPAKTTRVQQFNQKVGLDIKYLDGWQPNQQVPCVSIVDHATSMHVMVPIFRRETGEILKGVLRDSWLMWAGPPEVLEMDPAKTNLSQELGDFCEGMGINQAFTAADSHWQLGKVERHGQWFAKIYDRVRDECRPSCAEEFVECIIQTQVAKNTLLNEAGYSPYQLVYGRNPRVPQDLLQEEVHLAASDAVLTTDCFARSQAVRHAARMAVLQCQDDKALRAALRARPRTQKAIQSGDWCFYWRSQKWENGTLIKGGKWCGAGLILGRIGINWIVAHRRSLFRVSPEQIRLATEDERTIAEFDEAELLGIKTLLEKGQFPKSQFLDLVHAGDPPIAEELIDQVRDRAIEIARSAGDQVEQSKDGNLPDLSHAEIPVVEQPCRPSRTEDYGPFRRVRHSFKSPPEYLRTVQPAEMPLHRPPGMAQDDFAEMMEHLPQMIEEATANGESIPGDIGSPRGQSTKREASRERSEEPPLHRPRHEEHTDENLFVQKCTNNRQNNQCEVLLAGFLQKRSSGRSHSTEASRSFHRQSIRCDPQD